MRNKLNQLTETTNNNYELYRTDKMSLIDFQEAFFKEYNALEDDGSDQDYVMGGLSNPIQTTLFKEINSKNNLIEKYVDILRVLKDEIKHFEVDLNTIESLDNPNKAGGYTIKGSNRMIQNIINRLNTVKKGGIKSKLAQEQANCF